MFTINFTIMCWSVDLFSRGECRNIIISNVFQYVQAYII